MSAGGPDPAPVCVVGAGTMGAQIALLAALAGHRVELVSRSAERLDQALADGAALLERRVGKGRLSAADRDAALGRLQVGTELAPAAEGAEVVIESVVEDREAKCTSSPSWAGWCAPTRC